jgi:hypothetical protein
MVTWTERGARYGVVVDVPRNLDADFLFQDIPLSRPTVPYCTLYCFGQFESEMSGIYLDFSPI